VTTPDESADPVAIALDVGRRLAAIGLPWVIGGSLASSVHGEPRATLDVDMVVGLRARQVNTFVDALERDYYIDRDTVRTAVRDSTSFNAVHFASAVKIDFFVAGADPFEAERLSQRMPVEMPDGVLFVDSAEHTLLRKLEWYRRGGESSERQWRDVLAIARIQGDRLDRERLLLWAGRLGVTDLLERVLVQNAHKG
jgi:hypothetical protein